MPRMFMLLAMPRGILGEVMAERDESWRAEAE